MLSWKLFADKVKPSTLYKTNICRYLFDHTVRSFQWYKFKGIAASVLRDCFYGFGLPL